MSVNISLLSSGVQGAGDPAGPSDKAVSVTVLLTQALRADDRQLLEKCFAISNDKVVNSTVQQLAPQDVARLLQVAVQRLQSSPKRGKQIATWLRAMLLHHTAYLMSAPGMFSVRPKLLWSSAHREAFVVPVHDSEPRCERLPQHTETAAERELNAFAACGLTA